MITIQSWKQADKIYHDLQFYFIYGSWKDKKIPKWFKDIQKEKNILNLPIYTALILQGVHRDLTNYYRTKLTMAMAFGKLTCPIDEI